MKVAASRALKHKRRYCKVPGCSKIVKSQGRCQRHGAKPRKCRVTDCPKQAQGNYDGCCKRHFREFQTTGSIPNQTTELVPFCQPVRVDDSRSGEESTVSSRSTEEGRELWDEPLLCSNNEELAADLFGFFPEAFDVDVVSRTENRGGLTVSSIPSCSDYTPHMAQSSYMDYYVHENARAAV